MLGCLFVSFFSCVSTQKEGLLEQITSFFTVLPGYSFLKYGLSATSGCQYVRSLCGKWQRNHTFTLRRQASQQTEWCKEINKHSKFNLSFSYKRNKWELCKRWYVGFSGKVRQLFKQKGLKNPDLGCTEDEKKSTIQTLL